MRSELSTEAAHAGWNFDNSYTRLPASFYARQKPTPVRQPQLAVLNHALGEHLGLDLLNAAENISFFAGNQLLQNAEPIAQAYAGHQFGRFTVLGDGRAILLGEHVTPSGKRFDIQLKGSGQTPYSRRGDGRAALGPMLREYIISEAMYALGIPTTRSLAVISTGEPVYRETALPGAILTRVAASHIRVGTFQYAGLQDEPDAIRTLADYTIQRHYPDLDGIENPYHALLHAVMEQQASLVAKWQCVGFIHGVMNTDNMTLSGETIDYGPCAFMDAYDPATVFSSIDGQGRYAYQNQPGIAQWNLARLTETLLPLLHAEPETALQMGQEAIETFPEYFQRQWLSGMRAKLGLMTEEAQDVSLIEGLLNWMHQHQADFTNTFRMLSLETFPDDPIFQKAGFADWHTQWQLRLTRQAETSPAVSSGVFKLMQANNPAVIPRNHRVEAALAAAVEQGDYSVMHSLLSVLANPYAHLSPENSNCNLPPEPNGIPYRTFCGT